MELDVRVHVPLRRVDQRQHPLQLDAHRAHVLSPGPPGGETRDLDLKDLTHLQQLPQSLRPNAQQEPQSVAHGARVAPADHRPPAVLDAYEAPGLEKVEGLAYDRAADAQPTDELALGREALSLAQPAGDDHVQELISRPVP